MLQGPQVTDGGNPRRGVKACGMDQTATPSWLPPVRRRWQLARLVGRAATAREAYLTAGLSESQANAVGERFDLTHDAWASPCRAEAGADGGANPAWVKGAAGPDRIMVAMQAADSFSVWLCFGASACDSEAEAEAKGQQLQELTGRAWAVVAVAEIFQREAMDS